MQLLEVWNRRALEQELSCPESQQFYQQMIETWRGKVGKVKRSLFGDMGCSYLKLGRNAEGQ